MSTELLQLIEARKDTFVAVCSDPSIEFDRECSFAMQLLTNNQFLMDTALRNKASLQAAITNVAAIGISLNPASKQAYLVPRDGKVCLDISYIGMMHLAQRTGAISWGQALIVKANDTFELNGLDKAPLHKFNPFSTDRGETVGVYVVVKTDTGDYLTHAMPISKVFEIRDRSTAYKAVLSGKAKSCPWTTNDNDEEEMIKKTCVKQAAKYWPRRDRLDNAIHHLNVEGEEGINFEEEKEVEGTHEIKPAHTKSIPAEDFAALNVKQQEYLRGVAKVMQDYCDNCEYAEAIKHVRKLSLEANEYSGLWSLFKSPERRAMKEASKAMPQDGSQYLDA